MTDIVVTGMGLRAGIASSIPEFSAALREGACATRIAIDSSEGSLPASARTMLRHAPPASRLACAVAMDAWLAAGLTAYPQPEQVAVIVAGNNIHQSYITGHFSRYLEQPAYISPRYAVNFFDTHVLGAVSELVGARGFGFTAGGASASGNVALFQAFHSLRSGQASVCLCVGALADYSSFELQAFINLGAMSAESHCRPFDSHRTGFVYGQGSACIILETRSHARNRGAAPLAQLAGVSLNLDANHSAEPEAAGEARAMRQALHSAEMDPAAIDYVNAHGTASQAGDLAEAAALREVFCQPSMPLINSTKALTGHTLYAAGIVEAIATIIQMRESFIHPNPFLDYPIDTELRFAGKHTQPAIIRAALSNSFGFGGINSSVVLRA
jgi:malonyl-ACP decarboxylase